MSILAYALAFVTFVLVMLDVEVLGAAGTQLLAAGLAFVALALLIGSLPRPPRA